MTNQDKEQAGRIRARQKIRKITTGELPLNPLKLIDDILLSLLDTPENAIRVIGGVLGEYELVLTENGMIDLKRDAPPATTESSIVINFKEPTWHSAILPEMPTISKKSTKRNSDGNLIDIE